MQIPEEEWRSLSHLQRRVLVNKERRRRKRQAAALKRQEEKAALESQPGYLERLAAEERLEEERRQKEEAKRLLEHEAWLEKEKIAQEAFRLKREKEEKEQREKEERERLIREEWELLQKKEREAKEKRERLRRQKEERLQEALSTEKKSAVEKPTHNPLAPDGYKEPTSTRNYGTEKDTNNCPFFLKTGTCRFGDACSRVHPHPISSTTLLIPGMYSSLGLTEWRMNDRDDAALEHEEGEMYEQFRSFYDDVLPEFLAAGEVIQFKVSCNYEPHLRGNVYVQYKRQEECSAAFQKFNGRWYAQRQLSCQFCPVQRWRNAICGLYSQKRCPKGKHCNFLHVFRNPEGAFSRADRDLPHLFPPSSTTRPRARRERRGHSRSRSRSTHRRRSSREGSLEGRRRRRSRSRERRRSWSRRRSTHGSQHSPSPSRKRERRGEGGGGGSEETERAVEGPNGVGSETVATGEKGERHKKKKKRKRRSDDSLSPSSSSRRHHKHRKHKKKRERSSREESCKETTENTATDEKNHKLNKATSPEAVGNHEGRKLSAEQGPPAQGPPTSEGPSILPLTSKPQNHTPLQQPMQA